MVEVVCVLFIRSDRELADNVEAASLFWVGEEEDVWKSVDFLATFPKRVDIVDTWVWVVTHISSRMKSRLTDEFKANG